MKQSDDSKAFLEKFGFTQSIDMKHPTAKEPMHFDGFEAKYVNELEFKVQSLEKYIGLQNDKIDWLMSRDMYLIKERLASKGESEK